jgi:hypothetical protein
MLKPDRDAPPVLLTVTVCGALATPGCCVEKFKLEGLALRTGGAMPVPASAAVCVLSASETVSVPARLPTCVGANTTLMVHAA